MSLPEVFWRIGQKKQQKDEKTIFFDRRSVVTEVFNQNLKYLHIDSTRMHLNLSNKKYEINNTIPLLCGYDYKKYKTDWSAGFQTENKWPIQFSYDIEYRGRDDIGDARTNWELNRHFQFALLAKNYAATNDAQYLNELSTLFENWNENNPFLWGITWTSVMEAAIRCSNWCYTYCFLHATDAPKVLLSQLETGILNMTDYITKHYSRYSSANNHLLVEAFAVGQSGILFQHQPWIDEAIDIISRELPLQNSKDGVNKEMSLHYQSFGMEAVGLLMRLMKKNDLQVPADWELLLNKMCSFIADCMGEYGEVIEFGDNDGGKILDLVGGNKQYNHYQYVLRLYSYLLEKQYIDDYKVDCENLEWLFDEDDKVNTLRKEMYQRAQSVCYREGGYTILRSSDRRVLIGIDHADLGYGKLAAHGHADALSFQLFFDGKPVFIDPGTSLYHCDIQNRIQCRKTENHNTVSIDGRDQSEMLGAFLWGKKANAQLIEYGIYDSKMTVLATHDGYSPVIHKRNVTFDGNRTLSIKDMFSRKANVELSFLLLSDGRPQISKNQFVFISHGKKVEVSIKANNEQGMVDSEILYYERYGIKNTATKVIIKRKCNDMKMQIILDAA